MPALVHQGLSDYVSLIVRGGLLVGGVVLNGVATRMYIGTHLGPGQ